MNVAMPARLPVQPLIDAPGVAPHQGNATRARAGTAEGDAMTGGSATDRPVNDAATPSRADAEATVRARYGERGGTTADLVASGRYAEALYSTIRALTAALDP